MVAAQPVDDGEEAHPVEVEVKLRADAAGLAAAYQSSYFAAAVPRERAMRSVYFDTPDFALHRAGIVLRMRHEARGKPLMCMKFDVAQGSALFNRHEIEVPAERSEPDLALFDKKTARRLKRLLRGLPLEAKFETVVKRRLRTASAGGSLIEAAFDEGHIVLPDGRRQPLCELELELKSGAASGLFELARHLVAAHPLRLDVTSKSEKGFALLRATEPAPRKAGRVKLERGATLDEAVAGILSETVAHFTGNWEAVRTGDDPESIHQLRVALRRMRSAFRMFSKAMPAEDFTALAVEAGIIAAHFGRARDLDAFIAAARDVPASGDIKTGLDTLLAEARSQRSVAFATARATLDEARVSDFVLRVEGLVGSRAALPEAAISGAGPMLDWLWKRVKKRGDKLDQQSEAERHRLRIALKDLRYGADFLSGLFGHAARAERLAAALSALQDLLGRGNDAATSVELARDVAAPLGAEGARAAGYASGWLTRDAALDEDELAAAWKALRKTRKFWRG